MKISSAAAKKTLVLQCSVHLKIVLSTYRHQIFTRLIKKNTVLLSIEQFLIGNGCIHDEKGLVISFQLEIFLTNVKRFHIGLRQEISVRNHMCQWSACFMEDRCMFIGFVVAYGGFIWFY